MYVLPLAEGRPLGCYRYVTFPIPAVIEESLTAFAELQCSGSASPLLTLVEKYLQNEQHRALSDGFRHNRGTAVGHLAMRSAPLLLAVGEHINLDSADLLTILIPPFRDGEDLALEADVLEVWLGDLAPGADNEHLWDEWRGFARMMRAASELARSLPAVALLFDA